MIIIDTDVLSLLQLGFGDDYHNVRRQLAQRTKPEEVFISVITVEEQMRGWLDWIAKAKDLEQQVFRYRQLRNYVEDFKTRNLLDFDKPSAERFYILKKQKIRIGTMDLKIAAIAMSNRALLISRNLSDYRQVPGLQVEDWTKPT